MDATDQFRCPVCLEIPPDKIFQCCNGHTVCSACFENLTSCPECRAKYGQSKIRTLALETILNARKFNCPNKSSGCKESLGRSEISGHLQRCDFSDATVPLCKILGCKCNFKTCTKNTTDAVLHFTGVHNSTACKIGRAAKIHLENLARTDFSKSNSWTPTLFVERDNFNMKGTCILFAKINEEDKTLSLIPVVLGVRRKESNIFQCHFAIRNNKEWKNPMEWSTSVVTLYDIEQAITQPFFRIPEKILKADYVNADGCLEIMTLIKRKQEGDFTMAGITEAEAVHVLNDPQNENDASGMNLPSREDVEERFSRLPPLYRSLLLSNFLVYPPRS